MLARLARWVYQHGHAARNVVTPVRGGGDPVRCIRAAMRQASVGWSGPDYPGRVIECPPRALRRR